MRIIAIWERPQAHPKWGGTFCLLESGELLYVTQGRECLGTDPTGEQRYQETGVPEYSPAFHADDRFDLDKADMWVGHFGGQLLWAVEQA